MSVSAARRLRHAPLPAEAWRLAGAARRAGFQNHLAADPFNTFESLMKASEAMGTPAEFYFMAGVTNRRYDEPYSLLQPGLQNLLRQIDRRGHVIGLHPSYESFRSEEVLCRELETLRHGMRNAGLPARGAGGRQHYLRWEAPTTWRGWDRAGLEYDATLGYPDQPGFRCGTAREFPVFDLTESRQLRLRERPLIAMDVTLTDYLGLSRDGIGSQLRKMWGTVRQTGGTFEVLIHNCNPLAAWTAETIVQLANDSCR